MQITLFQPWSEHSGVVLDCLKEYEIDLRQILTITTDNGKNILKIVRDIDAILQNEIEEKTDNNAPSQSLRKSNNTNEST